VPPLQLADDPAAPDTADDRKQPPAWNRADWRRMGKRAQQRGVGRSAPLEPHPTAARVPAAQVEELQAEMLELQGAAGRAAATGDRWVTPSQEDARRAARKRGKAQRRARKAAR
jgi:hypothetical protein